MRSDGELHYPFTEIPEPGEVRSVAEGVLWLRMPLPFRLDHINLYLLKDGDGYTVVDTGVRGEKGLSVWGRVLDEVLHGAPVKRVISTHMHPDHVGQAGWLCRHFDIDLWMTRTEFLMCRLLTGDGPSDVPAEAVRFYERAGFNQHQLDIYRQRFGYFGSMIEALPAGYRRIVDGERIEIDGVAWEVIVGRGHSPEHACLHCAERGLLLSGDQILPRISSNVSVFPLEPEADPLAEWIDSCHRLRERLPGDTLVLPSHNEPFTGVHARLDRLIAEHHEGLEALHALCAAPQRVVDVFPALFRRPVGDGALMLATGESLAHLNYLRARGRLVRERGDDGVDRYRQG